MGFLTMKEIKMKSPKITGLVKQIFVRFINQKRFHIITTIILAISMGFLVVMLGMYLQRHVKKFMLYKEFPELYSVTPDRSLPYSHLSCNCSISIPSPFIKFLSKGDERLKDDATTMQNVEEARFNRTLKVAFLFLTRGRLPLAPLWERFFKGHDRYYSVYIHTSPDYSFEPPQSSVFYKRRIPSKPVEWGKKSMIDAERRLLKNALLDISNQRFILLSESCIPLFNFTTIYNYLINSNQSFLGSFDDPRRVGRGRYNKRMSPAIILTDWRKGSQWFEIHRKLAVKIVSDDKYYAVFTEHCNPPCYMDEHYLPTLVNKVCPEMTSNRSVTWTDWSLGGSHPTVFTRKDVSEEFLNRIRFGSNCTHNGETTSVCFLFARKFHSNTLETLIRFASTFFGFN